MIVREISDEKLDGHLDAIGRDGAEVFLLAQGTIRITTVHGTFMANQMRANHDLEGPAIDILTKAYLAALSASSSLKNLDRLGLVLETNGPVRGFAVDANAQGQVRGYLSNAELREDVPESLLVGQGTLAMIRYPQGARHPIQGQIADLSGDLAIDMEQFYERSEQMPARIKLDVHRDEEDRILGAASVQVQRLPGCDDEDWQAMERLTENIAGPARQVAEGLTLARLVHTVFGRWKPKLIATKQAEFYCGCSKERFGRFLSALPKEERDDILEKGPFPLTTVCHNCNSSYVFTRRETEDLFAQGNPYENSEDEGHNPAM